METIVLELDVSCGVCDSSNVNIWGTIISGKLRLDVRCMRCGSILKEITRPEKMVLPRIPATDSKG